LDYVAAAWLRLPPHVQEAIVTVVAGTLKTTDEMAPDKHRAAQEEIVEEAAAEWTAILWATPLSRRTELVRAALAVEPTGVEELWEVGRLRAVFSNLWESATGAPMPVYGFAEFMNETVGDTLCDSLERLVFVDHVAQMQAEIVALVVRLKRLLEEKG
jgi:hypothetical protein